MGLTATPQTAIPVNLDDTLASWTWGESGGPFPVPGMVGTGYLPATPGAADDVNYPLQLGARWSRAMRDRMVFTDEGLFTTCLVRAGAWNIGGGTLEITLTPTRVVIDVNSDGGVVLEIYAPPGSPELLTANRDTYVDIDEAGDIVLVPVPNGNPAPAVTAGHVRVWTLVTNASELTGVTLAQGVAPFPCLGPVVGAVALFVPSLTATGPATFEDDAQFDGEITVDGPATFNGELNVLNTGFVSVDSLATFSAPLTNYTHAVASDWRDAFRPSERTFTASGVTDGGGAAVSSITITGTGNAVFSKATVAGLTSAIYGFELFITVVVGSNGSGPVPTVAAINTVTTRRVDAVATLNNGAFTLVTLGTPTGPVDGTAPTIGASISGGNVVITITFATPPNAPYRIAMLARSSRCAIAGP